MQISRLSLFRYLQFNLWKEFPNVLSQQTQVLIQSGDYSSKKCIKLCMLCKTKQKCVIFCFKMFVAQLVIARSKKALKSVSFA